MILSHENRAKKLADEKKRKEKSGSKGKSLDSEKFSTCELCKVVVRKSKANFKEKEHHEARHSKETLFRCFPALDPSVARAVVPVAAPKYKPDKPLAVKKKKKKRK